MRVLLAVVFVVTAALIVLPANTSQAAEPAECAPLPMFSAHQPYAKDAAQLMAVEPGLDPKDKVEVWDTAKGRPAQGFTLYQAMGMSGATWSSTKVVQQQGFTGGQEGAGEWACAYLPSTLNMVANSMFDLAKLITAGTISFRSLAANPQLVVNLFDQAVAPVNQISTQLFLGMSVVMVMLTGAYVVLTGALRNRNRQRETLQALLGVGVFMLIGTFLVIPSTQHNERKPNYYWLTTSALNTINSGNQALASTLLPKTSSAYCSSDDARRTFDCLLYQNMVFEPWANGQFGTDLAEPMPVRSDGLAKFGATVDGVIPTAEQGQSDLRLVQLWTQGYTASEVAHGPRPAGNPQDLANAKPEERQGQWNAVREVMWTHYNPHYPTWQGANAGERVNLAFFALLLSILVGAFVVVTSALLLLWNCVLVVLFFFLPILALAGLFPPTQRIFRTWLTTWLKALGLSFVFQLGQTLAMLMVTAALSLPNVGMGMKAALLLIMLLALWKVIGFTRNEMSVTARAETPAHEAKAADTSRVNVNTITMPAVTAAGTARATANPVTAAASRGPGVARTNPQALSTPGKRREAKLSALLAEAEERWVAEHGNPMDERTRVRVREDLLRSQGVVDDTARTGTRRRSAALGAAVRNDRRGREAVAAKHQVAAERAGQVDRSESAAGADGASSAAAAGPTVNHTTNNYNFLRTDRPKPPERAARGSSGSGLSGPGNRIRRGTINRSAAPETRELANEARRMEAEYRRRGVSSNGYSSGDPMTPGIAAKLRATSFREQLVAAQQEHGRAVVERDKAAREFQLVSGQRAKGQATDEQVDSARRTARQASVALEQATVLVQNRTRVSREADRQADEAGGAG
ncbi:hypothetical protein [Granulicoccus phenolivorans]|uniref:hypothetical protein n=1 Tax=Granulicoccus phenolivorans TaxID=266854 RepID=UPI0003FFD8F7|nr:hypothetical protein [Granulicoccus phenolivorans]